MSLIAHKTMVTIEPVMDFNISILTELVRQCHSEWVNIGANTNTKVKLPEPEPTKIRELTEALREFTEVKIKKNLDRLL